jgi:cyclopropane fatty-acyl-phospholipid synthase-like methyltransferase
MSIKAMIPARARRMLKRVAGMKSSPAAAPQPLEVVVKDAAEYWSGSETGVDKRDMSHWLGEGRWADEASWRRIGEEHYELYKTLLTLAGRKAPIQTMMEWGQGGGANAIRFVNEVSTYLGVDISEPNLKECARQLESRGHHNFRGILIDALNPESVLAEGDGRIDFFMSTAVFQHFPNKEYGVRVTKVAHQLLADDGIALIQTRYLCSGQPQDDNFFGGQPRRVAPCVSPGARRAA